MRVLIAGASGAIGRPLVAQLVAAGHTVVGMTRSDRGAQALRALGAAPVVADARGCQANCVTFFTPARAPQTELQTD